MLIEDVPGKLALLQKLLVTAIAFGPILVGFTIFFSIPSRMSRNEQDITSMKQVIRDMIFVNCVQNNQRIRAIPTAGNIDLPDCSIVYRKKDLEAIIPPNAKEIPVQ